MINVRWVIESWAELQEVLRQLVQQLRQVHRTYGVIWVTAATTQVINNAATQITICNAEEDDGVTASHANDKLTIDHTGRYLVAAHLSLAAQAGSGNVTLQIWRNGSAIVPAAAKAWVGNGEYADIRAETIGNLDATDELTLYALGGGGLTFDIAACSLSVKRVA